MRMFHVRNSAFVRKPDHTARHFVMRGYRGGGGRGPGHRLHDSGSSRIRINIGTDPEVDKFI